MRELVERRGRHSKHVERSPGRYRAVIGRDLHWRAGPGQAWQDVDLTVQESAPGTWMVARNRVVIQANYNAIQLTDRETNRSFSWVMVGHLSWDGTTVTYDGIPWQYRPTRRGIKSYATVATRRGPRTYAWNYLTDATGLHVDEAGNLVSDQFRVARAVVLGANGRRYLCGLWQLPTPGRAQFAWDDSDLPDDAFPYIIDPTTQVVHEDDLDSAYIEAMAATYPPTEPYKVITFEDILWLLRHFDGSTYFTSVVPIRWDTSSLPNNAVVTGAELRFETDWGDHADNRSVVVEWYDPDEWPLDYDDFAPHAPTGDQVVGTHTLTSSSYFNQVTIPLTGAADHVDPDGYTAVRLHVSGGEPTWWNGFGIYRDGLTLVIDYELAAVDETAGGQLVLAWGDGVDQAERTEVGPAASLRTGQAGQDQAERTEAGPALWLQVATTGWDSRLWEEVFGRLDLAAALAGTDQQEAWEPGLLLPRLGLAGQDHQAMVELGPALWVPVWLLGTEEFDPGYLDERAGVLLARATLAGQDWQELQEPGVLWFRVLLAGQVVWLERPRAVVAAVAIRPVTRLVLGAAPVDSLDLGVRATTRAQVVVRSRGD